MPNPYDDTLSININYQCDFILETILRYKNLENLELTNIKFDDFTVIEELLENLNFLKMKTLNCQFTVKETQITIKIINEQIHLGIFALTSHNIKDFLKNLPQCINCIYIKYPAFSNDILNDCFTNLPTNLKKIEIEYTSAHNLSIDESVKKIEEQGMFNCLFGAKLPFGCEIILHIKHLQNIIYTLNVIYENNEENELTLSNFDYTGNKMKYIIIKYRVATIFNYATNYNILRIMSGMGGLSYSS